MARKFGVDIDLKIIDNPGDVHKKIMKEMVRVLNNNLPKVAASAQKKLRTKLGDIFYDSDEYTDILRAGRGDFGFEDGTAKSRLRAIIDALQDTTIVTAKKVSIRSGNFAGGLVVEAFPDDFNYILSLPEASVNTQKGDILHWLFNMLLSGDRIIIADYIVEYGAGKGRSGIARMVKSQGGGWRVPPNLAGTANDNWITRSVKNFQRTIQRIIEDVIQEEFIYAKII